MGREAKIPVTDRLKGECSGIFSRNISGGDTAPVCDGIYVSERPDRQERNLLARHRNYCTRLRTVAQHGKEGVEGSGGKGIFEEGNPSQVFFVKHFSLKKASEFPVFSEGFSPL